MKRFINVRVPVLIASVLALGVATGYLLSYYTADIFWLLAIVPVTAILFIVCILLRKIKLLVLSLILIAVFTGGLLNSFFRLENFKTNEIELDESYYITGTVAEKGSNGYGEYLIITNAKANGKKLDSKICAQLAKVYGDYADVGYTVEFNSTLSVNDAFPYGKLNKNAIDNIKYSCSQVDDLSSDYHFSLFGSIRTAIRNTLYNNLSYDTASVCYAMLIGDTTNVDDDTLSQFRYGGIAHIFAVSGLHIGVIFLVLGFILKLFNPNKYVSSIIRLALIIFYSGVCGFSISSIRAVIMCAISMIAVLSFSKYDALNSLSCAVVLILFVTPLSLFSVGFQLSVCAVAGITLLSKPVATYLGIIKIPNKIASSAGMAVGAQLGTFPIMLSNFGYVSASGIFLNILIIPVISILFIMLFVGTLLSALIPVIAPYVLPAAVLPLEALLSFILICGFERALISGFGSGLFIPIYYIALFALSDKINYKFIPRIITVSVLAVVMIAYSLIMTYAPFSDFKVAVSANHYGGNVIIKSTQGTVLICDGSSNPASFLNENYSSNLDAVIILGGDDSISDYDTELNCSQLYLYYLNFPAQPFRNVSVHYERYFTLCGIEFEFVNGCSLYAQCGGVDICICTGEDIPFNNCNLLVSKYPNTQCDCAYTVYFSLKDYKYNIYDFGDFQFTVKNNELLPNGIIPNRPCYY